MKDKIVIHCSATRPEQDIGAHEIREWHTNPKPDGNGWSDIGYNAVIRRDGRIEPGRDLDGDGDVWEEHGAHARGFNRDSVGICLVGGLDEDWQPDANFTPEQMKSLRQLVQRLLNNGGNIDGDAQVLGHRDLPNVAKACPCFDVKTWWRLCA